MYFVLRDNENEKKIKHLFNIDFNQIYNWVILIIIICHFCFALFSNLLKNKSFGLKCDGFLKIIFAVLFVGMGDFYNFV